MERLTMVTMTILTIENNGMVDNVDNDNISNGKNGKVDNVNIDNG